jgi:hypothetical protein
VRRVGRQAGEWWLACIHACVHSRVHSHSQLLRPSFAIFRCMHTLRARARACVRGCIRASSHLRVRRAMLRKHPPPDGNR